MGAFPRAGARRDDQLFEVARRTFDTPEFRGITFIEVEAKTIINRVAGGMPFDWTLNPYRGCSHACSYCLAGETPILMADGRTKKLADVRVGDEIVGTERRGSYRRYVRTRVLAHWSTVKPAYRITLEDGTALIASGDHRFLSDRGWKHVSGSEQGRARRPHLTLNNSLIGTGRFEEPPKADADYRLGYLCGVVRGDANLATYRYARAGRANGDVHRFRFALADGEALSRSRDFFIDFGVDTKEFLFTAATERHREMRAIRTSARADIERIQELVAWPEDPSIEWMKGFLAGIFDAEGSFGQVVRICNGDPEILGMTARSLDALGLRHVLEPARENGVRNVRILGGLKAVLRFFHLTDPAITRKRTIDGRAIKSNAKLGVVTIQHLGIAIPMFDITTGTGDFIADGVVSHNCFARVTHTYMDMNAGRDFENQIVVKVNAPDVLRAQLRSRRWKGEPIAMGTGTDPYQRAEGRYRLMPAIIRALIDYRNPFSILTKGTLIQRDIDLLAEAADLVEVGTAFSIGTLDEEIWRRAEPGTPHPRDRMKVVKALNAAGVPCGVMLAPVLPGINDKPEQLRAVVEAALDAGATHVSPILLHLRPVVKEEYLSWLGEQYPDLLPRMEQMYARGAYAPSSERKALGATVGKMVREQGGVRPHARVAQRWRRWERSRAASTPAPDPEQLRLL